MDMRRPRINISCNTETVTGFKCTEVMIDRNTSIEDLESLREGQWVLDEYGEAALLLEIEIKTYKIEKHIYVKLSSMPKTILIIR